MNSDQLKAWMGMNSSSGDKTTSGVDKVCLIAFSKKEIRLIKKVIGGLHNKLLKEAMLSNDPSNEYMREITGGISKKTSFCVYSVNQEILEKDLYNRLKAYKEVQDEKRGARHGRTRG